MNEIISIFYVDIKLLIAQAVNFAIVFAVLYYFGIKPLMKILTERSKKVEDSLKNAEQIEKELLMTEKKRSDVINQAKKEASEILAEIDKKGEERKKDMMSKAKVEIEKIVSKTKDDLEVEKKITIKHIKEEAAEMIVVAMEKVLGEKIDGGVDKKYIERVVKEIEK